MSGYRELVRTELIDEEHNRLAVILETNDKSWKVFARHYERGMAQDSAWVNYPTEEGGKAGHEQVVGDAEQRGWVRSVTNCRICKKQLNTDDPNSLDCGGDCLGCMNEEEQR